MKTTITLVYPFSLPSNENTIFMFPPLGLGYIAASLKKHDISVDIIDCTFMKPDEALERIRRTKPKIIGIQSMLTMEEKSIEMAKLLRNDCDMLVAGGPLPTLNPTDFLEYFDVAVMGEGEETTLELVQEIEQGGNLSRVKGIAYKENGNGKVNITNARKFINDLDSVPFPARELFEHQAYKDYFKKRFGYTISSLITSRGCPFSCEFCSKPIFGSKFRARSPSNIVDEVETILRFGYNRLWFADDCFTLGRERLVKVCNEIMRRGIRFEWECLSRVDTIDRETAAKMKQAGCVRVFFGIESGNDNVLRLMRKQISTSKAMRAVHTARESGLQTGAFFIVGYPGETNNTVLDTVNFASMLPLDYISFNLTYPVPGTLLYERLKEKIKPNEVEELKTRRYVKNRLLFQSPFSETKLKLVIMKAMAQYELRKFLGARCYRLVGKPFEHLTNFTFKLLR